MLILSRFWYGLMVLGSYIRLNREGRLLVLSTSNTNISGYKNVVEKAMATYSSILAWRIPVDGGAWWAAVYGVTQTQTRLKPLSSSSRVGKFHGPWSDSVLWVLVDSVKAIICPCLCVLNCPVMSDSLPPIGL